MTHENARADRDEAPSPEVRTLVQSLRADLRALGRSFSRALTLEWLRLQLKAVDAGVRVAFYCCVFAFCLALFIAAGWFIASGLRDWLGNLAGGLAILILLIGAAFAFRYHVWTKGVRNVRRVLTEREPREP